MCFGWHYCAASPHEGSQSLVWSHALQSRVRSHSDYDNVNPYQQSNQQSTVNKVVNCWLIIGPSHPRKTSNTSLRRRKLIHSILSWYQEFLDHGNLCLKFTTHCQDQCTLQCNGPWIILTHAHGASKVPSLTSASTPSWCHSAVKYFHLNNWIMFLKLVPEWII